jgi:hypothetical protein
MTRAPAAGDDFAFRPEPPIPPRAAAAGLQRAAVEPDPLAWASGSWRGPGFNTIWRPFFGGKEDEFLELDLTDETLDFREVAGEIPNRGFDQPDITMHGVAYTDQISDAVTGAGLHLEPGLWLAIPATTAPEEPPTVARLASIPHGTSVLAQGFATFPGDHWPALPATNIVPFDIGRRQPRNSDAGFAAKLAHAKDEFQMMVLAKASKFRLPPKAKPKGITQAMVDNPSVALEAPPAGATFHDVVRLHVTTVPKPVIGGGTANTAFLKLNADAVRVVATFQVGRVEPAGGTPYRWLQYVQTVLLDFDDLSWPHVTVANLTSPVPA